MGRPFRVMIDARMLIGRFSGVSRVVVSLVEELAGQDGIKVVALCGESSNTPWPFHPDIEVVRSSFSPRHRDVPRRVLWEETRLPGIISASGVDLFHATWNYGIPIGCPVPAVLTVHDLIPWSHRCTSRSSFLRRTCYRYAVRASVRRAARITTVSDYANRQVVDTLAVHPERITTVPNGVAVPRCDGKDDGALPPRAGARGSDYVLYVGGHEPRKNLAGLFKAMYCYWQQHDPTLELRLTGTVESLSPEAAAEYRKLPPRTPLRFLGDISDAQLARQYASAQLLLLLSHDEGFGLPVLEAMAHGCPVVAANRAALPEVAGGAGILVDPDDPHEVASAIRSLVTDPARRDEFVGKGMERARSFSWQTTASKMRAVYERALREANRPGEAHPVPLPSPPEYRRAGGALRYLP